jgi:hypothetical protein
VKYCLVAEKDRGNTWQKSRKKSLLLANCFEVLVFTLLTVHEFLIFHIMLLALILLKNVCVRRQKSSQFPVSFYRNIEKIKE